MERLLFREYGEELERRLKLKTYPLAVKLLKEEGEIPEGAKRPLKDFGYHLLTCQGFATSRREGIPLVMLKEDMWCVEPVIGYGLAEAPEYFLQGYNRYPEDVETLEAGRNYAQDFPRLPTGSYIGIVSSPLKIANFTPDLAIIYCDSSQLNLLLLAREYKDGHDLACHLSSHAACVYSVVPPLLTGQCQVAIPCRGDHYLAMAGDDEMIFTVPMKDLEALISGLRHLEKSGSKLPRDYRMSIEPQMRPSYIKLAQMVGMDISGRSG